MSNSLSDKQRLTELEQQMFRLVKLLHEYKSQTDEKILIAQSQIVAMTSALQNLNGAMEHMAAAAALSIDARLEMENPH